MFELLDVGDSAFSLTAACWTAGVCSAAEPPVRRPHHEVVVPDDKKGCSVGNMSVVLYDSHMHEGATLGPLALLMKGEVMPAGCRWHGIPTVAG
jgi:hypothetical protein